MTTKRRDNHSTEFGLWLRNQRQETHVCPSCNQEVREDVGTWREFDPIDSALGYVGHNVDYVWRNYKTSDWMLIEEKRKMALLSYSQQQTFSVLDRACHGASGYRGFYVVTFENTNPEDGRIWIDDKEVDSGELIEFLSFFANGRNCAPLELTYEQGKNHS